MRHPATHALGAFTVNRMGYGAMQLAGPGIYGPPRDPAECIAVLREAVESGVNHIDTSDFYGPEVTNKLIREALAPYPQGLVLVTKVGARRGSDASWIMTPEPAALVEQVYGNLRNLGVEALDVVNLRIGHAFSTDETSLAERFGALRDLQQQGKIRHIGLSNVTAAQIAEARAIGEVACVQNAYNIVQRADDALIDALSADGIPYVPFFPLGGFSPLQSAALDGHAASLGASPMQLALAWLLHRAPNVLLIPGTSSRAHLRENLAAARIMLSPKDMAALDAIAAPLA
ncbi:oxidoreductase [Novosphingobium sp. PASSN1]|uniref:oxidoreductase n=1 Tax=Novosphingobium sp. PASSN1 TaxID=2015561 RepID=UPI0025DB8166|nr:oxidoreductase [Novosphingobium sp. PASSN1]